MKTILLAAIIGGTLLTGSAWAEAPLNSQNSKAALVRIAGTPGYTVDYKPLNGASLSSKKSSSGTSDTGLSVALNETCSKQDLMKESCKFHCNVK